MQSLARGVLRLRGLPPNTINVYLIGGVLVDAGTPAARSRILRQLDGRDSDSRARPRRRRPVSLVRPLGLVTRRGRV